MACFELSTSIIFLSIFALSWIVPDHFPPWTSFHTEVPSVAGLLLGLILYLKNDNPVLAPSRVIWVPLLLVLVTWGQFYAGLMVYAGDAAVVTLYLFAFLFAWTYGYNEYKSVKAMNWTMLESLSLTMVIVGLMVLFQLMAQWLHVEERFYGWVLEGLPGGRARANVGQPNQAATTQMIAIVSVVVLYERSKLSSSLAWLLVSVLSWSVILTQSRTSFLAIIILTFIGILFSRTKSNDSETKKVNTGCYLIWFLLTLSMVLIYHTVSIDSNQPNESIERLTQAGTRLVIWSQLVSSLADRPIFGFGVLQVASAQQVGALLHPGFEQTNFSHNVVIDILVMLGLPLGGAVVLTAGGWFCCRLIRNYRLRDVQSLTMLLVPPTLHANLEFPHAYTYFVIYAGIVLGIFDKKTKKREGKHLELNKRAFRTLLFITSILAIRLIYEYAAVEEDFRVNRFDNARLGRVPDGYVLPNIVLLTQFDEVLKAMRLRASENMKSEDLELLLRVSKRYTWAPIQFRTALSYALNGNAEEAENQLKIIKSLFPRRVYDEARESIINLSEVYPQLNGLNLP